jgi:transposase
VSRPQVIDDQEHERVHERVAAIDVAKDTGMVCTRTPHPARPGARRATVWTVKARMNAVRALGRQLKQDGIEVVTLESTSDYWRIWFFVLEACGLAVQLIHAAQAKNLPGRPKTDKSDAMWLARLTELGLLRASFVPPKAIRDLRDYTRARARLVQERTRCWQRLEKLLEAALVKVSSVASKLTTVSAQDMIKAMIAGQRDPEVLAALARGRMKAKHDDLVQALDGMFDDHHGELAGLLLDQIAFLDHRIAALGARAAELTAAMPAAWGVNPDGTTGPHAGATAGAPVLNAVARLAEIPGVSENLARAVIAETGLDMTRFPTAAHLVSWAGLCPSARQSGPRSRPGKKQPGPGRHRRFPHRHLPRRALLPHRPPPRQGQGPGRRGPLHPGHHLAPAEQPRGPVHRPRPRLLPGPYRHRPQAAQPHPADPGARLRRHPHQGPVTPISSLTTPDHRTGPGPLPRAHLLCVISGQPPVSLRATPYRRENSGRYRP